MPAHKYLFLQRSSLGRARQEGGEGALFPSSHGAVLELCGPGLRVPNPGDPVARSPTPASAGVPRAGFSMKYFPLATRVFFCNLL